MKLAVFGTGVVGQTMAAKLSELGHDVMMGTRNVADTLAHTEPDQFGNPPLSVWHGQHTDIKLGAFAEAGAYGIIAINATSGAASLKVLKLAGEANLKGKILIDISNPLDFSRGFPPSLSVCNTDSLGEQIQDAYPDTKVVKAFNTMNAYIMVNPALIPGDHTVFMSGNDEGAKAKVKALMQSFGWKEENIMDVGDITTARGTEQLLPIWIRLYGKLQNPMFNFYIAKGPAPKRE
jgi:predicted dinucleotide-binding enzyme